MIICRGDRNRSRHAHHVKPCEEPVEVLDSLCEGLCRRFILLYQAETPTVSLTTHDDRLAACDELLADFERIV